MSFPAPPPPTFRPDQAGLSEGFLRYEDVTQTGHLMPLAIPPAMSGLWHDVLSGHAGHRNGIARGVLPILTRMTVASCDQPIRVDERYDSHAGFELARCGEGDATRIFMNVWAEVRGAAGRIGARAPGGLVPAGRLFSEHTFTRPFAPADQRRITRLDIAGYPALPDTLYDCPAPTTAAEPPDGARWLDELAPDPVDTTFTLDHTDSNQHVNSLVYVRLFLDAAQRRLVAAGRSPLLRSRGFDIAYRKPCFAGDRVRAQLRLYEHGDEVGAAGFLAAPGEDGRPRCYVRASFGR